MHVETIPEEEGGDEDRKESDGPEDIPWRIHRIEVDQFHKAEVCYARRLEFRDVSSCEEGHDEYDDISHQMEDKHTGDRKKDALCLMQS